MPELSARGVGSREQRAVSEQNGPAAGLGPSFLHRPALLSVCLCAHDLQLGGNPPDQPQHACGQVCRGPHLPPDAGSPDHRCHELFVPLWRAVPSGLHPEAAPIHAQLHCVPGLHHRALPPGRLHFQVCLQTAAGLRQVGQESRAGGDHFPPLPHRPLHIDGPRRHQPSKAVPGSGVLR